MNGWLGVRLSSLLVSVVTAGYQAHGALACPCTLQWQPSPDTSVAGYAVYYENLGSSVTNRVDVGQTTSVTFQNLNASATYLFYVVAYDLNRNESAPSNLVQFTAPAIAPLVLSQASNGTMNISFFVAAGSTCHVEYSASLNAPNWTILTAAVGDSNGLVSVADPVAFGSRFYRAVVP